MTDSYWRCKVGVAIARGVGGVIVGSSRILLVWFWEGSSRLDVSIRPTRVYLSYALNRQTYPTVVSFILFVNLPLKQMLHFKLGFVYLYLNLILRCYTHKRVLSAF